MKFLLCMGIALWGITAACVVAFLVGEEEAINGVIGAGFVALVFTGAVIAGSRET